jgi:hypothetical protein
MLEELIKIFSPRHFLPLLFLFFFSQAQFVIERKTKKEKNELKEKQKFSQQESTSTNGW